LCSETRQTAICSDAANTQLSTDGRSALGSATPLALSTSELVRDPQSSGFLRLPRQGQCALRETPLSYAKHTRPQCRSLRFISSEPNLFVTCPSTSVTRRIART